MKKLIGLIACIMLLGLSSVFAQSKEVTGTVTDITGNPLPGVSVAIKGTTSGTATDINGKYTLNVTAKDVLVVSFVGMKTQEITVGDKKVISIKLDEDRVNMDEVIVVAYGTSKKSSFTGAASQVNSKKLEKRAVTNIVKALDGAGAGIQVNSGNGQPGSSPEIRIRGFGSINGSNDPLYVVDGVPYNGSIANINSDDIASISVLKDAASTSLYGSRAANGAILITTKKGKKNRSSFNVKVKQGVSQRAIEEYERVNAYEYYPLMWEAYRNSLVYKKNGNTIEDASQIASQGLDYVDEDGKDKHLNSIYELLGYNPFNVANNEIVGTDGKINPNAKLLYADDLDWYKPLERLGHREDYNMTASGGNEKSDYYISLGYTKENGFVKKSDYERLTARVNVNTKPKDWIKLGLNLSGTLTKSNQVVADSDNSSSYNNVFYFARNMGPIYPVYAHNPTTGEYILDFEGNKIYDLGTMKDLGLPTRASGASPGRHVVAETMWNKSSYKKNVLSTRAFTEFYIKDGLKLTLNASVDLDNYNGSEYENPTVGDGSPAGRSERYSTLTTTTTLNQLITYQKSFGQNNIDILVGHESYAKKYEKLRGFRQGVIVEGNAELINFTETNSLYSYFTDHKIESYLSRFNYNFDEKYFVSASFRRDGSSKFYKDVRWGNFWSIGGSWKMDREEFIQSLPWISSLKLRASYGEVGNDGGIDEYAWQPLYGSGYNNASEAGFYQESLGNLDLEWESNSNFDIAVEFGLFDHKLTGNIEFFNRQSSNLLFDVPQPLSSGVESQTQNIGTMFNRGVELFLSARLIDNDNFKWTLEANATTLKNEITKLPQEEMIVSTKKYKEGRSRYDFWLRDWYGVDPSDGMALYVFDENKEWDDANCRTVNDIKVTTDANKAKYHYAGTAIPDVYGSFTNKLTYKGFDLSIMCNYKVGGDVYDGSGYGGLMSSGDYGNALHKDILNRWQKPGDITNVPRMDVAQTTNFNASSDRWLTSASYLTLKNVTLSYDFPKEITSKLKVADLGVYFSGENLWLKSSRKGMDPQQSYSGVISNSYVPMRLFTLGLNITF